MGKGTPAAHDESRSEAREPKLPRGITEDEWTDHMDADSGELVVEDTVGDIIADVLNRLHDHVLNRSAKPFLAKKAKDSLVCMIDASFLAHDTGEPDIATDPCWNPGEEPVPCGRDSWARGSVSVRPRRQNRDTRTSVIPPQLHFGLKASPEPSEPETDCHAPDAVPAEATPAATPPKGEEGGGDQGATEGGGSVETASAAPAPSAGEADTAADASEAAAPDPTAAGEPAVEPVPVPKRQVCASTTEQASGMAGPPPPKPGAKSAVADAMIATRNAQERAAIAKLPQGRNGGAARRGSFADGSKVAMKKVDGKKLPRNRVIPAVAISPAKASPPRRPTPPGGGRQAKSRHPMSRASKATKAK